MYNNLVLQVLQTRYASSYSKWLYRKLNNTVISYHRRYQHSSSWRTGRYAQGEMVSSKTWQLLFIQFQFFRDAWNGVKGTSKEEAQKRYVEKFSKVRMCSLVTSPEFHSFVFRCSGPLVVIKPKSTLLMLRPLSQFTAVMAYVAVCSLAIFQTLKPEEYIASIVAIV